MAEFKLVLNDPKKGKSLQKELKDDAAKAFIGLKLGDKVKGELIDLPGYEFEITGGSDSAGFPMRKDNPGTGKKKILAFKGVGVKNKLRKPNPKKKGWRTMKGMRLKKTVAGNTIYDKTAQINLKVIKPGRQPLFEEAKPEEAAPTGPAPAEAPKTEPKEAPVEEEEVTDDTEEKADKEIEDIEKEISKDEEDIKELDEEEKAVEKELEEDGDDDRSK